MKELVIGDPFLVQLNVTTRCLFECDYCYLSEFKKGKPQSISVSRAIFFLEKFREYHEEYGLKVELNITGGDLWLYPEVEKLLDYVCKSPFIVKRGLMINSLWWEKSRKLITDYHKYINGIQLNIDSINASDTDIPFLQSLGINCYVKVMLSRSENYWNNQIRKLKKILIKFPGLKVSVDRFCPLSEQQLLNTCTTSEMIKKVKLLQKLGASVFVTDDPLISAYLNQGQNIDKDCVTGCAIPNGGTVLFPDGNIRLCARLPQINSGFNWKNFNLIDYINKFQDIRSMRKCRDCSLFQICNGGCPATSYFLHRKMSTDINCLKTYGNVLY